MPKLKTAYKYVSLKYAEQAESGQFWIGTAESYARMEGPRRDPLDSSSFAGHSPVTFLAGAINDGREAMRQVGIAIGPKATVLAAANFAVYRAPSAFILCLSSDRKNEHLWDQADQALFEIVNVRKLARRVRAANSDRLGEGAVQEVVYGSVQWDLLRQPRVAPSSFRKAEAFAPEKEIRAVWAPKADGYVSEGFLSRPIATKGLVRRIA